MIRVRGYIIIDWRDVDKHVVVQDRTSTPVEVNPTEYGVVNIKYVSGKFMLQTAR